MYDCGSFDLFSFFPDDFEPLVSRKDLSLQIVVFQICLLLKNCPHKFNFLHIVTPPASETIRAIDLFFTQAPGEDSLKRLGQKDSQISPSTWFGRLEKYDLRYVPSEYCTFNVSKHFLCSFSCTCLHEV